MSSAYISAKDPSNTLRIFESAFVIFSLVHISQAIMPLILTQGANEGDGIDISSFDLSINAKISLLIYGVTLILLAVRWKKTLKTLYSNQFLLLLIGIICFSYYWSISPDKTLRYSIYSVGTTCFGLYMATRYTLRQQMNLLGWTYGLLLILSVLFASSYSSIWHHGWSA